MSLSNSSCVILGLPLTIGRPELSLSQSRPPLLPVSFPGLLGLLLGDALEYEESSGTYRSIPSGGGLFVFDLRPGLRLLSRLLLSRSVRRPRGSSIRSNKLRPGLMAVSNGLRLPRAELAGPEGTSDKRIGWPLALAPSNSLMAVRAELMER